MSAARFQSVDALRAVAALLVVMYHFLLFSADGIALFDGLQESQLLFEVLKTVVLTFFILTAMVIPIHFDQNAYTLRNYPVFLLKRLIRVHIPFLAVVFLIVLTEQGFLLYQSKPLTVDYFKVFANLTLTAEFFHVRWYNTIFWTLAIELQFYLVIGLVFPWIKKHGLTGTGVFFLCGELLHYCWYDSRFVWYYTPFFTLGLLLYQRIAGRAGAVVIVAGTAILTGCIYLLHDPFEAPVVIITLLLFLLVKNTPRFLSAAGKYTYSLYLVHGLFGSTFLYFTRFWENSTTVSILRLCCALLLAFAGSWIFYTVVEKRSVRLTHRIKYGKS